MARKHNLSDKEIEIKLGNAKASLAMEELYVTEEEEEIGRKFLKGELTEKEALEVLGI